MTAMPEPSDQLTDTKELFLDYLDYYRSVVERKVRGLAEDELRSSRPPSGWAPLELVKHLVYMERRWLRWGFLAERVDEPWGDRGEDERWHVSPDESLDGLLQRPHDDGRRTRTIVAQAELTDLGGSS